MCLRAEGLVGFRSSERRWSNISTRAINISLLRSELKTVVCASVHDTYLVATAIAKLSLPRSSICADERPTSTSKTPGSARHCLAWTS